MTYCSPYTHRHNPATSTLQALRSLRAGSSWVPRSAYLRPSIRFASTVPSQTLKINKRDGSVPTGIFINNEFQKALSNSTFSVENPATGEPIVEIQEGREEDVNAAVKAARAAFEFSEWVNSNPVWRAELLNRLAQLVERDKEDIVALEMLDTGKTYKQASNLDFPGSVGTLNITLGGWTKFWD